MDIRITPRALHGEVRAIASKSDAHRVLICAALTGRTDAFEALCARFYGGEAGFDPSEDILATIACLRSLCGDERPVIDCNESGSTLRFMLPVAGALGVKTTFIMRGRLPQRPLSPLWEEMCRMGCQLTRPEPDKLLCQGKLTSGEYTIDGSVSSQYITGLLFATALIPGESKLTITGKLESKPYIEMTRKALAAFGVSTEDYKVTGSHPFVSRTTLEVEGDWSNAAFFLAAKALGNPVEITGLHMDSAQGDKAAADKRAHKKHSAKKQECIAPADCSQKIIVQGGKYQAAAAEAHHCDTGYGAGFIGKPCAAGADDAVIAHTHGGAHADTVGDVQLPRCGAAAGHEQAGEGYRAGSPHDISVLVFLPGPGCNDIAYSEANHANHKRPG